MIGVGPQVSAAPGGVLQIRWPTVPQATSLVVVATRSASWAPANVASPRASGIQVIPSEERQEAIWPEPSGIWTWPSATSWPSNATILWMNEASERTRGADQRRPVQSPAVAPDAGAGLAVATGAVAVPDGLAGGDPEGRDVVADGPAQAARRTTSPAMTRPRNPFPPAYESQHHYDGHQLDVWRTAPPGVPCSPPVGHLAMASQAHTMNGSWGPARGDQSAAAEYVFSIPT